MKIQKNRNNLTTETKRPLLGAASEVDDALKILMRRMQAEDLIGALEWSDILATRVSQLTRQLYHANAIAKSR